jgi:hypothetical protein
VTYNSSCLSHLSAGITDVHHHAQLMSLFPEIFPYCHWVKHLCSIVIWLDLAAAILCWNPMTFLE